MRIFVVLGLILLLSSGANSVQASKKSGLLIFIKNGSFVYTYFIETEQKSFEDFLDKYGKTNSPHSHKDYKVYIILEVIENDVFKGPWNLISSDKQKWRTVHWQKVDKLSVKRTRLIENTFIDGKLRIEINQKTYNFAYNTRKGYVCK